MAVPPISPSDVYRVAEATVPLYAAMICAYIVVRYFHLFTADQCDAIDKFVSRISVPVLNFRFIANSNPYQMSFRVICSDCLQKLLAFCIMAAVACKFTSQGNRVRWIVTGFSLSTIPNILIVGLPLMEPMYGEETTHSFLTQIVVMQIFIWCNLILFLYELDTAKPKSAPAAPADEERPEEGSESNNAEAKSKRQILLSIGKNLLRNPNVYAAILGLPWAFIKQRWKLQFPSIVRGSINIIADGSLGMAMFSLGLFMALHGSLIACGARLALLAVALRFIASPALMVGPSLALGLRGTLFRVAILQAILPQAIITFIFAKQYNVSPDIISTGVVLTMLFTLPVALAYYFLLGA